MKKLKVEFVSNITPCDEVTSNALMTQLMVTITQIGIRVDNLDNICGTIRKETEHGNE